MNTFLLVLSAVVATRAALADDPCKLTTWSSPGCAPGSSVKSSISVDQVRTSCRTPSIWWAYPCGTLEMTYTFKSAFKLCITNVIGGVAKMAYVAADGRQKRLALPTAGKPSCVAAPPSTKSVKLIFTATKDLAYGAGIDYTVA